MKKQPLSREDVLSALVVAIDGPAGSGKSTSARLVARRLGYSHIDTGAMYRAVALEALRRGVDPNDGAACGAIADSIRIQFLESGERQKVLCNGRDVSLDIRSPGVTRAVSPVSAHRAVRAAMVEQQRILAGEGGAVLEGRDIGTVVYPAADVKIYLVASTVVRAERRAKELESQGTRSTIEEVERDIRRRDEHDSTREVSPLRRAVGSVEIDTSELTIDEQVARIVETTHAAADRLRALSPVRGHDGYRRTHWHYGFGCILIRSMLKVFFGLRVSYQSKVDYEENYIFACNHKSYADPPFVGSTLQREVHFIAKAALFRNRLFAWLIRTFNAVPMRRSVFDREAMNHVVELLREHRSLMIFPEGSRVRAEGLGRPKSGVGFLAVNSGTAVVPVFVSGTDRLWRCLLRRERLQVFVGRPLRMAAGTREEFAHNDGYRAYAEMVMESIEALKSRHEHSRGASGRRPPEPAPPTL